MADFKLLNNITRWTNVKAGCKKNKKSNPERAEFIMQKGYNTSIIS